MIPTVTLALSEWDSARATSKFVDTVLNYLDESEVQFIPSQGGKVLAMPHDRLEGLLKLFVSRYPNLIKEKK